MEIIQHLRLVLRLRDAICKLTVGPLLMTTTTQFTEHGEVSWHLHRGFSLNSRVFVRDDTLQAIKRETYNSATKSLT